MSLTFTNGVATFTHNYGYNDSNDYVSFFIPINANFIVTSVMNQDGNTTQINAMNYNSSGLLDTLNGSFYGSFMTCRISH